MDDQDVAELLRTPRTGPVNPENCVVCGGLMIALKDLLAEENNDLLMGLYLQMAEHAEYGHPEDPRTGGVTQQFLAITRDY
ncbi:hypothetical protein [Streptomyces sp. NPDC092952]|uniref:hypothetical protein n=1 Tax=Streptomyces sp. NPDC092952 TaxID=3366018 RepID=UPI0037FD9A8B